MSKSLGKNLKSTEESAVLLAEDITVAFGGFVAVKGMNLEVA